MRILVINGPNLDMLGRREPEIYGQKTLEEINAYIAAEFEEETDEIEFFQSNSEGAIIDKIHEADSFDGAVINPGAYAHYSYAIYDAIRSVSTPFIEVHISQIETRPEPWRRQSVTAPACRGMISGRGIDGYIDAINALL